MKNLMPHARPHSARLSTLTIYIAAMGGDLKLVAAFPGRPPVILANHSDLAEGDLPKHLRRRRSNGMGAVAWH
ncbi:hypothetical protein [Sphingobium sp. YR768]|uniref:hypothetical protein n=1 Tax=Sphingobium sp. YR768 TaxID=1884365 RepID=UPI001C42E93E|nr:hypothetical protein [Sphingobium sp. YR768]